MQDYNLRLDFLKRVLLDQTNNEDLYQNYFKTLEYPSEAVMHEVISSPILESRRVGRDWPPRAHTMVGQERLTNLQNCLNIVREKEIEGDFIETGVWRGGACIFVKKYMDMFGMNRKVFVADSFKGLPPPECQQDEGANYHLFTELAINLDTVKANFAQYGCLDEKVIFLEGWFKDTLPNNKIIEKLSILRMDGDMYKSTMDVFESCYHKLSIGGFCIIDDWCIPDCREAVEDWWKIIGHQPQYIDIDGSSIYWQKLA
jgi:O-methyltransferase